MYNENEKVVTSAPAEGEQEADTSAVETTGAVSEVGAEQQETVETVGVVQNLASSVEILSQGMASIFVVLIVIALVVQGFKKIDNPKKKNK